MISTITAVYPVDYDSENYLVRACGPDDAVDRLFVALMRNPSRMPAASYIPGNTARIIGALAAQSASEYMSREGLLPGIPAARQFLKIALEAEHFLDLAESPLVSTQTRAAMRDALTAVGYDWTLCFVDQSREFRMSFEYYAMWFQRALSIEPVVTTPLPERIVHLLRLPVSARIGDDVYVVSDSEIPGHHPGEPVSAKGDFFVP